MDRSNENSNAYSMNLLRDQQLNCDQHISENLLHNQVVYPDINSFSASQPSNSQALHYLQRSINNGHNNESEHILPYSIRQATADMWRPGFNVLPHFGTFLPVMAPSSNIIGPSNSNTTINFSDSNLFATSSNTSRTFSNMNTANNIQTSRPLKRQESSAHRNGAQISSPLPALYTSNSNRHLDSGCSTGIVQTPPSKMRRISNSSEHRNLNVSYPYRNIGRLLRFQNNVLQQSSQTPAIPLTQLSMINSFSQNTPISQPPSTLFVSPQLSYPAIHPAEIFVASALNAAAAVSMPSIVAATTFTGQPQCPVCVAAVYHHPSASTVSAYGNCIHHHHLQSGIVCQQHLTSMVCSQVPIPASNLTNISHPQVQVDPDRRNLNIFNSSGAEITSMGSNPNALHNDLLANRILQQELNRASANNFYQQQHQHSSNIVRGTQPTQSSRSFDPTMILLPLPTSDTALVLNGQFIQTHQVQATFIAAATAVAAAAGISEPQPVGSTMEEISKHSTMMNYKKDNSIPESEKERCIICLLDLETGEKIRVLNCTHLFHSDCIDKWLVYNKKCPVCRVDLDYNKAVKFTDEQN